MWELDEERERAIRTMPVLMRENGIDDDTAEFWKLWMKALRETQPRLLAYLSYMAQRLLVMHRILKPTGLVYISIATLRQLPLHQGQLDAIFGHRNFRNEIVWRRNESGAKGSQHAAMSCGSNVDYLFFIRKVIILPSIPKSSSRLGRDEGCALASLPKVDRKSLLRTIQHKLTSLGVSLRWENRNLCYAVSRR